MAKSPFSFVEHDCWSVGTFRTPQLAVESGRLYARQFIEHIQIAPKLCDIFACVDTEDIHHTKCFAGFLDELDTSLRNGGGA